MNVTPDETLMARIAMGDVAAFDALVRRHLPRAYAVARRVLTTREDAEEAAQDAFSKIWVKAADWKPERAKFTTWLYRIVVNAALDIARKKTPGMVGNADDVIASLADAAPSAETVMIQTDEDRALQAALTTLTAQQRAAITLCYFEHHTNPVAAEMMGLNLKALEGLLVRARRALREPLAKRMKENHHAAA